MIGAVFQNRDFSARHKTNWDTLTVERYSHNVIGGSYRAHLTATGNETDLWEFIEMLRCPVNIIDYVRAHPVWWGYISKVTIVTESGLQYGVDIETMANKLAIAYTYNMERVTTGWDSDAGSIAEYGTKEMLLSMHEKTADQMAQYQDSELEARKYPGRLPMKFGKKRQMATVRIECRGWWSSLAWRYYSQAKGRVAYEELDNWNGREIGEDNRPICAQSFKQTSGAAWTASSIWLRPWKVGTPADNLIVELYSDSGNAPNALLSGTDDIAGADVPTHSDWYEFTIDTPQALADSTLFWIRVSRSGAVDTSDYFMVEGTRSDGYSGGGIKVYNGSAWVQEYDRDLNFRVLGELETTTQITDCLTAVGEFVESASIEDTSGVNSSPYRNGDSTALYELEELLKVGTTNNRRLLASVGPNMFRSSQIHTLRVYEESAPWDWDYLIDENYNIYDNMGVAIEKTDCPVGYWLRMTGIVPETVNTSKLINASHLYVELSEYNARTGEYKILKSKDAGSPFDIFGYEDR